MKNTLMNRFVGAMDERDEYQKQEIYKELAYSGVMLYYASMLVMVVSLIIDTVQNTMSIIYTDLSRTQYFLRGLYYITS